MRQTIRMKTATTLLGLVLCAGLAHAVELAGVSFVFEKGPASDFPAANILLGGKVCYTLWPPA